MSKVITVTSGKGGTGKSTIATGLAVSLINRGNTVLIIDCDAGMRSLDILLGVSEQVVFDISDVIRGSCTIENAVYKCPQDRKLYFIPAPHNADEVLSPEIFKKLVQVLKRRFDYVIIDAPAGIGLGFETAVAPADLVLVIANTEPTSLRGCGNVRVRLGELNKNKIRLVINKFNYRDFKNEAIYYNLDEIIDIAGIQLLGIVPEDKYFAAITQRGELIEDITDAVKALDCIAARIEGESVPLSVI